MLFCAASRPEDISKFLFLPIIQCHFPALFLLVTSWYFIKFSMYFTLTIKNLLNQTLLHRIVILKWWILGFCPIYQTAYRELFGVWCSIQNLEVYKCLILVPPTSPLSIWKGRLGYLHFQYFFHPFLLNDSLLSSPSISCTPPQRLYLVL